MKSNSNQQRIRPLSHRTISERIEGNPYLIPQLIEIIESGNFHLILSIAENAFTAQHRTPHEVEHINTYNQSAKNAVSDFTKIIYSSVYQLTENDENDTDSLE